MNTKTIAGVLAALGLVGGGVLLGNVVSRAAAQTVTPPAQTAPQTPAHPGWGSSNGNDQHRPGGAGWLGFGAGRHGAGAEFTTIATTIGISESDLRAALVGGQTIAQVAQAHKVSPQAVIDALVKDMTAQRQTNGATLTDTQKTEITQKATAIVNNSRPSGGPHREGKGSFGGALTVAAKTIGIADADLQTALHNGQTIAQVAQAHKVTPQAVIDALVQDQTTKLQAKGTAPTAAQKTAITQKVTALVNGTLSPEGHDGQDHGVFQNEAAVAAQTIGIAATDLQTALHNGQTVAQVAQAHKVSPQTVIDAVVKDLTTKMQSKTAGSALTAAQKAQMASQLQAHVTAWVNGTERSLHHRGTENPGTNNTPPAPSTDGQF